MYLDLSKKDREFIDVMVSVNTAEVSINTIIKLMNKPKNYISVYRSRLLDDQLIRSTRHGYLTLTLPFFADFVKKYKNEYFI